MFVEVGGDRRKIEKDTREQFLAWLRRERYDTDALESGRLVPVGERARGQLLELSREDGSRAFRAVLKENRETGRRVTRLTVDVPGSEERKPWLWLEVESPDERYVATPRLACDLLSVFDAWDGGVRLGTVPVHVGVDGADALVDAVLDPSRRGLVFVASVDEQGSGTQWLSNLKWFLQETVGLAGAYVLDPAATVAFNQAIGPHHVVSWGTMRTFRPGVEPGNLLDTVRHRVLSRERITGDLDPYLARLLGRRAREAVLEAPLPEAASRVDREFEQEIDKRLVAPLSVPRSSQPSETLITTADGFGATVFPAPPAEVRAVLGVLEAELGADLTPERVRETIDLARLGRQARENQAAIAERLRTFEERVEQLTNIEAELRQQLEDTQLELRISEDEKTELAAEVKRLKLLLKDLGWDEETQPPGEDTKAAERPDGIEKLLDRLNELRYVEFTGDRQHVLELDKHDKAGVWAGKIWDALCALDDYVRAKAEGLCNGDVESYLRNTPSGYRGFSPQRHGRDESEDVKQNPRFRKARMLPVPPEVDSAGKVFMRAHFKIAQCGMISPRLHYHDDTARSGKIYVGYIGRHLPTKRTN